LLSRPLIAAAAPVLRIFGMPGKLARQNAVRNPRRTAATASALMIGLTLITGLTVIAGGIQNAIDKMARDSLKADYIVSMASMTPLAPEVGEKLEKQPEVEKSSPLRFSPSRVNGKKTELAGVNGKAIGDLTKLEFTEGSFAGLGGNRVVVDKDLAEDRGWKVGSSLPTTFEDGKKSHLVVSGIY
ncbi:ABC transporter permease, partial [Streptomyces sp. AC627_RSS907]|uniref:ABC transporter permease n=1 Tax=Streptomyces sp. AC627_RSS907 TaxID=2823684 RepID=UPI001C257E92